MTTTTATTINPATCPSWCTCPDFLHEWYWTGESAGRDHDGPSFGEHVDVNGQQHQDGRCSFTIAVGLRDVLTTQQARSLASGLLEAAEWIEAQA